MTRPLVFRVFPEARRSLFVRVRIHPTLKSLRNRSTELYEAGYSTAPVGRKCIGFCTTWQSWVVCPRRVRRDPCVAEVNLSRRHMGTGVLTHEVFHATVAWARRVGIPGERLTAPDCVNEDEERLAYVHGALCRDIVDRAYAAGIYA